MKNLLQDIEEVLLMGPGPSCVPAEVYWALSQKTLGHLDPYFLSVMDQTQELLRCVFQTANTFTIPVSGTGSAGMETSLCNFIEPGDPVLICVGGYFGERLVEIAGRYGANVRRMDKPWGQVYRTEEIQAELKKFHAKIVVLVQGETSTGALQQNGFIGLRSAR